jgi:hypothetical protein
MNPLERFKAGLAKLQNNECDVNVTVQKLQQDNKKQADLADQLLQEKQAREWEKRQ